MRRRSALKSIAAGALSIAGCQCIVKKEVPVVSKKSHLIDMYWDNVNNQWVGFEQIEFSSSVLAIKANNGSEFKFARNACWVVDKERFREYFPNDTLWVPMYDASKPKFPKDKFIDGVNNDIRNGSMKKNYVGQYYEITHKDLNLHTILYI